VANAAGAAGTNTAVYLWDAQTGVNTLVSADTNNALPAAAVCDWPLVSSDGRYVTFLCSAGLTTNTAGTGSHVYRRDVVAGVTVTVDTETNGADNGDDSIVGLSVSDDGQIAAFDSTRPTMATADGNGDFDVFVRDLGAGTTELISARQLLLPSVTPNGISRFGPHALSQDGRVLAFSSEANNLVPGDTNQFEDVFARDLHQGTTVLASVGLSGAGASGPSCQPAISGNGQFVAFTSRATNLVAGYANNGSAQIFLRDLQAGVTTLVTVNRTNTGGGNADSEYPVAGYDGRFILFSSYANNLSTASYTSGSENFFLHDQQVGTNYALTTAGTAFAAMTPDGHYVACADNSSAGRIYVWDSWQARRVATNAAVSPIAALSISRDGNRIACFAGSGTPSLYLFDRAAHTNWVVAKNLVGSHPGLKFSADGNCLAYACAAGAMISNQVYVCNIPAQTNVLVSHAAGSPTFGDGQSDWPDISADGRYVAYRSNSGNLVTGGTNVFFNIYLCDTVTGSNTLLSADTSTGLAATRCSSSPVFSGDGRTLIFRTWADNLVANDFNQTDDLLAYAFLYSNASLTNGGNLTLDWPAAPGQTFTVLYANDLANPVWQTFTGPVTTNGYRAFISDATGNSAARFYRVISNP
jgi:Tol biopolymer transport system component